MDSRASTSSFDERYELTVNGQPITPARINDLELSGENTVVLRSVGLETLSADLNVNGKLLQDKGRPYETPEAVEWRWMPAEASYRHLLRLQIEGDAEYLFEVSAKRERPGDENLGVMTDEIREFSLNLLYSRYGDEIKERQQAWFSHVSEHWKALEPIVMMIAREPHGKLSKRKVKKPIQEVDRVDTEVINSLLVDLSDRVSVSGSSAPTLKKLLESVPLRVTVEENYLDHDVAENRLLRHHLDTLTTQLEGLLKTSVQRDGFLRRVLKLTEGKETVVAAREFLSNQDMMDSIQKLMKRIEARYQDPRLSFLEQVAPLKPPRGTMVTELLPHYSKFYQQYLSYNDSAPPPLLKPLFPILETQQDLDELYRRWCTVKILEAAINMGCELQEEMLTHLRDEEIAVEMSDGLLSTLTKGETKLELFYDKMYLNEPPYGSYSALKRVSIALEEFREDEVPRIIVFEPSHDPDYTKEKFEARDIDRLHVLRDAIVDLRTDGHERLVVGGCVLHPSNMEQIQHDGLYAVSLIPGTEISRLSEVIGELLK